MYFQNYAETCYNHAQVTEISAAILGFKHANNVIFTTIYYTYQIMEWLSIVFVILIEAGYSPERLNYFYMNDNRLSFSEDSEDNLRKVEYKWQMKLKRAFYAIIALIFTHVAAFVLILFGIENERFYFKSLQVLIHYMHVTILILMTAIIYVTYSILMRQLKNKHNYEY